MEEIGTGESFTPLIRNFIREGNYYIATAEIKFTAINKESWIEVINK